MTGGGKEGAALFKICPAHIRIEDNENALRTCLFEGRRLSKKVAKAAFF